MRATALRHASASRLLPRRTSSMTPCSSASLVTDESHASSMSIHVKYVSVEASSLTQFQDLVCPTCFSSALSAVSVTQGAAKCPACMEPVTTFETYKPVSYIAVRGPNSRKANNLLPVPEPWTYETSSDTIVMRIDNVAWVSESGAHVLQLICRMLSHWLSRGSFLPMFCLWVTRSLSTFASIAATDVRKITWYGNTLLVRKLTVVRGGRVPGRCSSHPQDQAEHVHAWWTCHCRPQTCRDHYAGDACRA